MGAPQKPDLRYYIWEVNAFDVDVKLFDLMEEYGTLGESVYRRSLDIIYSQSYYFEGSADQLAMMICKKIGSKWIKRSKCREILLYCVDIGLFDHDLVQNGIWTSVGIQKRYLEAIKLRRRKLTDKKFFIQTDDVLNALKNCVSSEETKVTSEETSITSEEIRHKGTEHKGTELNRTEQNGTEHIGTENKEKLLQLFQIEFGHLFSDDEKKSLLTLEKKYDYDSIVQALKRASMYQKVSFGYITQILKNADKEWDDE